VIGLRFKKLGYPLAPMVLALVLGDRAEENFRNAIKGSQGDLLIFFSNGLVGGLTGLAFVAAAVWPLMRKRSVRALHGKRDDSPLSATRCLRRDSRFRREIEGRSQLFLGECARTGPGVAHEAREAPRCIEQVKRDGNGAIHSDISRMTSLFEAPASLRHGVPGIRPQWGIEAAPRGPW